MAPFLKVLPPAASTVAPAVDRITIVLLAVCGAMAALIFVLIVLFGALYRKGASRSRKIDLSRQNLLEWGWTLSTLGVFMGLFIWGAIDYFKMHLPPAVAYEVTVLGKQWMWTFEHPDGHRELDALHIPVGKPILLTMTSQDVIHSLFIPAFRTKQDVVPGRYTYTWFEATKPGTYHLFCTQYCGTMHADMRSEVIAMAEEDFSRWLQTGLESTARVAATTRVQRGEKLFNTRGCLSCHAGGSNVRAPDLNWVYGSKVMLTNGALVVADDNYLRESIINPRAKIAAGFEPIMPSFSGSLNEDEILDLIGYIKSLKGERRAK